jgi:hypothetical protein
VAVFEPAASTDFDFDAAVRHAMDNEQDYDLEDYEIAPISLIHESPVTTSTTLVPNSAIPAAPSHSLPVATPSTTSRHAPPKPGTAELAYRKAKGKAREKMKVERQRRGAPYGHFTAKSRQVKKHIKESGHPIQAGLDANDMRHASTGYLGARYTGGTKRVYELDEVVGDESMYGFELRKWDGR